MMIVMIIVGLCCFGLVFVVWKKSHHEDKIVEEDEISPYEQWQKNEEIKASGVAPTLKDENELNDMAGVVVEGEGDAANWAHDENEYDPYAESQEGEYAVDTGDENFNPLAAGQ